LNKATTTLFISSVTDAYQKDEDFYKTMPFILQKLQNFEGKVQILTKSALVTRDIELFKQLKNLQVGLSINSLDDNFRAKTESGSSSIEERLQALEDLNKAGISTYAFIAPIFPKITKIQALVERLLSVVQFFYFENLNLKGSYKITVLKFIETHYTELYPLYNTIYNEGQPEYWHKMEEKIKEHFRKLGRDNYKIFFHH
jgi:DNA repair photolyase